MKTNIKYVLPIMTILLCILFTPSIVNAEESTEKTYRFWPEILNIYEGEEERLYVRENGEEISDDIDVTWKSSNEKIAKLKGRYGLVKAKKKGKAVVTAVVHGEGKDTVLTCKVNVYDNVPKMEEVTDKEFISDARTARNVTDKKVFNVKHKYDENKKYYDITKFYNLKREVYQKNAGIKGIKAKSTRLKGMFKKYEKRLPVNRKHDGCMDSFDDIGDHHDANTQFYMNGGMSGYYVMYKKDLKSGKALKCKIAYELGKKISLDFPELGYAVYSVHGDKVAIECMTEKNKESGFDYKDYICIIDMKNSTYQLIDYKGLIAKKYGICEENPKYSQSIEYSSSVDEISFLDGNRLTFRYCGNIYFYNIKKGKLTKCIEIKPNTGFGENGGGFGDISIRDGIWSFIQLDGYAASEFYAVDLRKMAIVSYVELDKEKDFDYGIYRNGVNYFVNGAGLYVYNPDTKAFDTIYDKMEKGSGYTAERLREQDEKYLGEYTYKGELFYRYNDYYTPSSVGMGCVFKSDTEIYLRRSVSIGDDGWSRETLYKKIKLIY